MKQNPHIILVGPPGRNEELASRLTTDAELQPRLEFMMPGVVPNCTPDLYVMICQEGVHTPQAVRALIGNPQRGSAPVVLLSSWPHRFDVLLAATLHPVVALLRQPADLEELRLLIRLILEEPSTEAVHPVSVEAGDGRYFRKFCHEVNNFLEVIVSSSSFLEEAKQPGDVQRLCGSISRAAQDLGRFVRNSALIQTRLSDGLRSVSVPLLLTRLLDEIRFDYPGHRVLSGGDDIPPRLTDPTDLRAILEEIVRNALEGVDPDSGKEIRVRWEYLAGNGIVITVEYSVDREDGGGGRPQRRSPGIGRILLDRLVKRNGFDMRVEGAAGRMKVGLTLPDPEPPEEN